MESPNADRAETKRDYTPKPYIEFEHADWTHDAVIYQINVRQYSAVGTFKAVQADLPRIKELGVDILWIPTLNYPT